MRTAYFPAGLFLLFLSEVASAHPQFLPHSHPLQSGVEGYLVAGTMLLAGVYLAGRFLYQRGK